MYSKGNWALENYKIKVDPMTSWTEISITVHSPEGKRIGFFLFKKWDKHPVHGKILHIIESEVCEKHRRKGIATHAYLLAEEETGYKLHNEPDQQTNSAKAFWNQPNRKFGK